MKSNRLSENEIPQNIAAFIKLDEDNENNENDEQEYEEYEEYESTVDKNETKKPVVYDYSLKMPFLTVNIEAINNNDDHNGNSNINNKIYFLCKRKKIKPNFIMQEGMSTKKGHSIPFSRKKYVEAKDVIELHVNIGMNMLLLSTIVIVVIIDAFSCF